MDHRILKPTTRKRVPSQSWIIRHLLPFEAGPWERMARHSPWIRLPNDGSSHHREEECQPPLFKYHWGLLGAKETNQLPYHPCLSLRESLCHLLAKGGRRGPLCGNSGTTCSNSEIFGGRCCWSGYRKGPLRPLCFVINYFSFAFTQKKNLHLKNQYSKSILKTMCMHQQKGDVRPGKRQKATENKSMNSSNQTIS